MTWSCEFQAAAKWEARSGFAYLDVPVYLMRSGTEGVEADEAVAMSAVILSGRISTLRDRARPPD